MCLALILGSNAWAGRACEEKAPDPEVFCKAMAAGYANMQQFDTVKPKVALRFIVHITSTLLLYGMWAGFTLRLLSDFS